MTPARIGIIIALLATTLLGATGALVYRLAQRTSQPLQKIVSVSPTQTPSPSTTSSDVLISADWKTYLDEERGYSFKYPQGYETMKNRVVSADGLTAPSENTFTLISSVVPETHGNFVLTIKHKQVTDFISLEETVDQNEWCSEISFDKGKPFRLDNEEAMIFEETPCGIRGSTLIIAVHDNIIYLIVIENTESYSSIKREMEQILSTFKFSLSDQERLLIDSWLDSNNLNQYGNPKETFYAGGTPLFNERTGERTDRYEYILQKFPDRPWND